MATDPPLHLGSLLRHYHQCSICGRYMQCGRLHTTYSDARLANGDLGRTGVNVICGDCRVAPHTPTIEASNRVEMSTSAQVLEYLELRMHCADREAHDDLSTIADDLICDFTLVHNIRSSDELIDCNRCGVEHAYTHLHALIYALLDAAHAPLGFSWCIPCLIEMRHGILAGDPNASQPQGAATAMPDDETTSAAPIAAASDVPLAGAAPDDDARTDSDDEYCGHWHQRRRIDDDLARAVFARLDSYRANIESWFADYIKSRLTEFESALHTLITDHLENDALTVNDTHAPTIARIESKLDALTATVAPITATLNRLEAHMSLDAGEPLLELPEPPTLGDRKAARIITPNITADPATLAEISLQAKRFAAAKLDGDLEAYIDYRIARSDADWRPAIESRLAELESRAARDSDSSSIDGSDGGDSIRSLILTEIHRFADRLRTVLEEYAQQSSVELRLDALASAVSHLKTNINRLEAHMSRNTDALAQLTTIESQLESDEALEASELADLESQVADLRTQLANATIEDDSDAINAITARLQAADAKIQALLAANTPPAAPAPAPSPSPAPVDSTPINAPAPDPNDPSLGASAGPVAAPTVVDPSAPAPTT